MSDKTNDLPIPNPADFFSWMNRMVNMTTQAMTAAIPQTLPNPTDPLEMWKSLANRNEQAWSQFMRQMTATPEFAETLGRSAGTLANYRLAVKRAAQVYLDAANIPSRDDLAAVARQIVMLDAKVDSIDETLNDSLEDKGEDRVAEQVLAKLNSLPDNSQANEQLLAKLNSLENHLAQLPTREELSAVSNRLNNLESQLDRLITALNSATSAPVAAPTQSDTSAEAASGEEAKTPEEFSEPQAALDQLQQAETQVEAETSARPRRKTSRSRSKPAE